MKRTKRVISLILVVTMLCSFLFVGASANSGTLKLGDVNDDGKIAASDARLVLRCSAKIEVLTDEQNKVADINDDGVITAADARYILRYSAQLIDEIWEIRLPNEDNTYTVTFDFNYEGAPKATQNVKIGECIDVSVIPEIPKREGYYFTGWYLNKNDTDYNNYFDFETSINNHTTLYGVWVSSLDTDNDDLIDALEATYGTNNTMQDTDCDALNDYLEIFSFNTNPLLKDTDGNGVCDGNEDFDTDTLTNSAEIEINTDPFLKDTDDDGLVDGDEVNTYHTDPLKMDTDGDGASDGKEIELGTDPLVAQSSFDITVSGEDDADSVKPSVQIELDGSQVETLHIETFNNDTFFPETMPGYMGKAYDFNVDGEFSNAIISFEFDPDMISEESEPTIYYFNEETQELEALETTIEGNVASAEVTHFSKYILIDRKVYEESFTWVDVWDANKNYTNVEIVLVIDDSGSLGGDYGYDSYNGVFTGGKDPEHKRLEVARNFIDNANSSAKVGIVKFDGVIDNITGDLIECNQEGKEILKNYLQFTYKNSGEYNVNGIFDSRGQTYMYGGIKKAIEQFSVESDSTLKVIVVFTDGEAHDTEYHSSVINTALQNDIKIYTVGLGTSSSYFNNYLKPLSNNTDGAFYFASDAEQLADIYKNISEKIDIETDSDTDGIPDYYEDNMVIFSGVKLLLDKNNPDTDDDGLKDGEEVELKYEYNEDRTQVKVTGKINSYPTKVDSDDDGYNDDIDLNPLIEYKTPIILLHGLNDNTTCFGVATPITKSMNTNYGSQYTEADAKGRRYLYTDCTSHRIKSVSDEKLGGYLTNTLSYSENKNLFAFNYPNHDMVQYNGARLSGYITDLIATAQSDKSKDVVDAEYLFATKEDKDSGNVKFILIGHSMGGLVSRYYIENIGTTKVEKLITIDTPHYGSGLADSSDMTGDVIKFSPSIFDLNTDSTLFGGKHRSWDFSFGGIFRNDSEYALKNQSPALKGNKNSTVAYYAIGGYTVGRGLIGGELEQLAEPLKNTIFAFEFARDVNSKDGYKASINTALDAYSIGLYGQSSKLDLGDADGDNTVDHMSQFAIRFKGKSIDYQVLEKTVMIVNAKSGSNIANPFHNSIHSEKCMHEYVGAYIYD